MCFVELDFFVLTFLNMYLAKLKKDAPKPICLYREKCIIVFYTTFQLKNPVHKAVYIAKLCMVHTYSLFI